MRLYQVWLGVPGKRTRTIVTMFRAYPHRMIWDKFVSYRALIGASWIQELSLVSNPDWFPDTPEGWPDANTFLNGCFQAKRNLEK